MKTTLLLKIEKNGFYYFNCIIEGNKRFLLTDLIPEYKAKELASEYNVELPTLENPEIILFETKKLV